MAIDKNKFGWDLSEDRMFVKITYDNTIVMTIWIGEIIEGSNRNEMLEHIIECDNTEWLTRWQQEKNQAYEVGLADAVKILKGIS
jgi:hypothetical protein